MSPPVPSQSASVSFNSLELCSRPTTPARLLSAVTANMFHMLGPVLLRARECQKRSLEKVLGAGLKVGEERVFGGILLTGVSTGGGGVNGNTF